MLSAQCRFVLVQRRRALEVRGERLTRRLAGISGTSVVPFALAAPLHRRRERDRREIVALDHLLDGLALPGVA